MGDTGDFVSTSMKRLNELDPIRDQLVKFAEDTASRMGESAFVLSLFINNYKDGIDSLIQFSIALMLEKPLFFLVPDNVKVPKKLEQIADGIERYKDGDMKSAQEATMRLMKKAQQQGFAA
jgi:hypothetical protein